MTEVLRTRRFVDQTDLVGQLRRVERDLRRVIRKNNNMCPVCTGHAEWHTDECSIGRFFGGPNNWRIIQKGKEAE